VAFIKPRLRFIMSQRRVADRPDGQSLLLQMKSTRADPQEYDLALRMIRTADYPKRNSSKTIIDTSW